MDLIDRKILCELDLNCRIPISQLAKKLRISRNVAAYRIKNLEKEKIITQYICSLNLGLLGYKTYKIYYEVKSGNALQEQEFVQKIIEDKRVIHSLKTEGAFDYSVTVVVKNISELDDFMMGLKNEFKDLIKDYFIGILIYSKIFKLQKLLLEQKQSIPKVEKYAGEDKQIALDDKDLKILSAFAQSANLSVLELAKKTKLSLDIVKYRLKMLNKCGLMHFRVKFDFDKLGYYHYIVLLKVRQATKADEEKLITWCLLRKNVIYCNKRLGEYDFEINAAIKDINELNDFIAELKSNFHDIIDSYTTVINTKLLKINYVPF